MVIDRKSVLFPQVEHNIGLIGYIGRLCAIDTLLRALFGAAAWGMRMEGGGGGRPFFERLHFKTR